MPTMKDGADASADWLTGIRLQKMPMSHPCHSLNVFNRGGLRPEGAFNLATFVRFIIKRGALHGRAFDQGEFDRTPKAGPARPQA